MAGELSLQNAMVLCENCVSIDFDLHIEKACREFVRNPPSRWDFHEKHICMISKSATEKGVVQGCQLCCVFQQALETLFNTEPQIKPANDCDEVELCAVSRGCHPDLAPVPAACCELIMFDDGTMSSTALSLRTKADRLSLEPMERTLWKPRLWRSWMKECLGTHKTCSGITRGSFTPTRLLDVSSTIASPRLVEPGRAQCEYVALSRCWGGSFTVKTTIANYSDHMRGISFDRLPITFCDAAKMTRALGYRYLWIDCLCIVQDSKEDWLQECALMGRVYAGAALTIAADKTKAPSEGLFGSLDNLGRTCTVPIPWPSIGRPDSLIVNAQQRRFEFYEDQLIRPLYGPLSKRGWTMQERILSQRVLHICEEKAFFECASSERTDLVPWQMSLHHWPYQRVIPSTSDHNLLLERWYGLIRDYANRNLTNAADRLPAISGVARIFAERLGSTHVAGLWSHDLAAGLLWYTTNALLPLSLNTARYRGPSWSWASVDRHIEYIPRSIFKRHQARWSEGKNFKFQLDEGEWVSCLDIQEPLVEHAGSDTFAEVKSGQLTILGYMRPVAVEASDTGFGVVLLDDIEFRFRPDLPASLDASHTHTKSFVLLVGFLGGRTRRAPWFFHLIVQPVAGTDATFRRVGLGLPPRVERGLRITGDSDLNDAQREEATVWDKTVDWLLATEPQKIYLV